MSYPRQGLGYRVIYKNPPRNMSLKANQTPIPGGVLIQILEIPNCQISTESDWGSIEDDDRGE